MTRWLEAAKRHSTPTNKTHKTNETCPDPGFVGFVGVLGKGETHEAAPAGDRRPGAVVIHLARGSGLPTHPATCAVCGRADWRVCLRDAKGHTMHVSCWKAEQIAGDSK